MIVRYRKRGGKMTDRTKEIIIKINTVVSLVFMSLIPGSVIYAWFLSERTFKIVFYTVLALSAVTGITLMILLAVFGLKQKPVKADSFPFPYKSFDELAEFLYSVLNKNRYQSHEPILLRDQCDMFIFTRKKKIWELDCFVVIRVSELTDDILEQANDKITEFLIGYYGKEHITDHISMITLVCVDRITSPFQKFVNSNTQQGLKNYRLLTGVSFGGKKLYVAKQEDGFAIRKYKKLKKNFLNMLNISCCK